ncbi:MAG: gliding motility-associated C-terminal domain-containing protein [Saprospiraceae bacterium]|nr:gliding motility-associated C-terminal domain-containing protein [Saprospiraceae bacterium]
MKVISTILFVFLVQLVHCQQPPICGNNPAMTSFCSDACIICDIDEFTGRNNSSVTGQAPPGFCTTEVHHMQWIGFIAGTTNLTLEVRVSNCNRNQGLEIGLYEGIDCKNFRKISDCDTDIQPNETRIFRNTVPLVIGQYYYFVMDGSANDICDWTIKVTEGSTKVAPLEIAPDIIIPEEICQGYDFEMKTPGLVGATFYSWSIDGVFFKTGTKIQHTFLQSGTYKVCLDASNVCDEAPQTCKNVKVLPTSRSIISQEICFGECFTFLGNKYCAPGTYEVKVTAKNGCDSIISFALSIKDKITAFTKIQICEGDTIKIGDGTIFTQGLHEVIIQNQEECNIFMVVDVNVIICNIKSNTIMSPVLCNGDNTGAISFKIDAGTPPFTYSGFKLENPSIIFNGTITNINDWIKVGNLDEGNYSILIEDNYGNINVINQAVSQPKKLVVTANVTSYNNFGVSCFGKNDGSIKWNISGGVPNYVITHDFYGAQVDSVVGLTAGSYHSIVHDNNGCIIDINVEINSPEPISVKTSVVDPDCSGPQSGMFFISDLKGGVPPYLHTLNNNVLTKGQILSDLSEGIYTLVSKDNNGCQITNQDTLIAAIIPDIKVPNENITAELGDTIRLIAISNTTDVQVLWTPSEGLTCSNCLETSILPLDDEAYKIILISKDGCLVEASIKVKVEKDRSFVISNVLTPNNDGINDKITYLAGKDVLKLEYFIIYDRWGNLVFKTENIPASGVAEIDWNADFKGHFLQDGVFTWIANVLYLDRKTINYKGSLTIFR